MENLILVVFVLTYIGMTLGHIPGLKLDRGGIALVGVVVLLATGAVRIENLGHGIDLPTLLLLFGLMIVSAQFAVAGFYDWVAARVAHATGTPVRLLGLIVLVAGLLSAVLANDIIAFAMAPVMADALRRRGLDPRPFLIALAAACNAGSAMTVIGNPQNILIGQVGQLGFWHFLAICAVPGLVSLFVVYEVVRRQWRAQLVAQPKPPATGHELPEMDYVQTIKGLIAIVLLAVLFVTPVSRANSALVVASLLLISRRISSRDLVSRVDWPLLLLFLCLFVVTSAFSSLDLAKQGVDWLAAHELFPTRLLVMAPLLAVASNTISNVPAVILILSVWQHPPEGAMIAMALLSTLAGNLFLVGSLANIIVVERAASVGVVLRFRDHARSGVVIATITIILSVLWLAAIGAMPL